MILRKVLLLSPLACGALCGQVQQSEISFTPETPIALSLGYGERRALQLDVSNSNVSDGAHVRAVYADGSSSSIERVLGSISENSSAILSTLPDRYFFADGITGTGINDGGGDMYDGGNYLSFDRDPRLTYSNGVVTESAGVSYFTLKLDGLFILVADYGSKTSFSVNGDLGADGSGSVEISEFDAGRGYRGFRKSVVGAGDPSVNHLILVPESPNLSRTTPTNTREDSHMVSNLPEDGRVIYLLFAKELGIGFDDSAFQNLADQILPLVRSGPSWLEIPEFDIGAGETTSQSAIIDAENLAPGTYETAFTLAPESTQLEDIPVDQFTSLQITVGSPTFSALQPSIIASSVTDFRPDPIQIDLLPENPNTLLGALTLSSNTSWLSAERVPGENAITVSFNPVSLPQGNHIGSLSVSDGTTTQVVNATLRIGPLSIFKLQPDPTRARLYAINRVGKEAGSILVYDTLSKNIIKSIAVGLEPSDLDLTEDGSELLVMNTSDPSIQRIDLESLDVVSTYQLTEFSNRNNDFGAHVADGPGTVIYYIDEQWGPRLRVFDTATETVLQTFSAQSNTTPNLSNDYGYGDLVVSPDKSRLYGWRQYGDGAGVGGSQIISFDISPTGELSNQQIGPTISTTNFNRDPYDTPALITADGSRLVVKDRVVDQADLNNYPVIYPDEILSMSPLGEIVASETAIYPSAGGEILHEFPAARIQTILPDYSHFVYFDTQGGRLVWLNLVDTIGAGPLGLDLWPADGAVVAEPTELRWLPVSGTTSYDVYLGTNQSAVANANPSSPEFLGSSSNPSHPLTQALSPGTTYYWRTIPQGQTGGTVRSFTVSELSLSRTEITTRAPEGIQRITEALEISSPTATSWSLSSPASWVSFSEDTGTTPSSIEIRINTTGLSTATHSTLLTINSGGSSSTIPLSIRVDPLNFTLVEADTANPYIYLISQESANSFEPSYLVRFDTRTRQYDRSVNCGRSVTDLTIHNKEDRIYLTNHETGILRAFSLSSLEQVQTYQFTPRGSAGSIDGDAFRVFAARSGRIVVSEYDQWINFWIIDTATGEKLAEGFGRTGDGVVDPTGRYYYHLDISNEIRRFDTLGDTLLDPLEVKAGSGSKIVMSPNGNVLVKGTAILSPDLEQIGTLPSINGGYPSYETIQTLTRGGEFALSNARIYNITNSEEVGVLPLSSPFVAVSSDQTTVFQFSTSDPGTFDTFDLTSLGVLASDVTPSIPDGGSVIGSSQNLAWTIEAAALSYDVYLGSDPDALLAATRSSPSYLGNTRSNSWPDLVTSLELGRTYYWRIDSQTFNGVNQGSVWSFQVAPLDSSVRAFALEVPHGAPSISRSTDISGGSTGTSWQASTSTSWINVDTPSGVTGDSLSFTANVTQLPVGSHEGSIRITTGSVSFDLPVGLTVHPLSIPRFEIIADSNLVMAISKTPRLDGVSFLLEIDASDASITRFHPIGIEALDLSLQTSSGKIFVLTDSGKQIVPFDRQSWTPDPALTLDAGYSSILATPSGDLLLGSGSYLKPINSQTGQAIGTSQSSYAGRFTRGAFSSDGTLYRGTSSSQSISSFTYSNGVFSQPLNTASTSSASTPIVLTRDSRRVFAGNKSFDSELNPVSRFAESITTSDSNGLIAIGTESIFWGESGQSIATLDFESNIALVSGDDRNLLRFNATSGELSTLPLADFVQLPGPSPQPGQMLFEAPADFSTPAEANADSYRFYLGTAATQLEFQSELSSPLFTPANALSKFQTYYWRIDARIGNAITTGEIHHFSIIPAAQPTGITARTSVHLQDRELLIGSDDYPYFGASVHPLDPFTGSLGDSIPIARTETGSSSSFGRQVVKAGDSYFTLENGGLAWSTTDPRGFVIPQPILPLPGNANPTKLAASGDLIFVSSVDPSDRDLSIIHIFRTFPEPVLEATISSPSGLDPLSFGNTFAASDSHLAVRAQISTRPTTTERIYIYRRDHSRNLWSLLNQVDLNHSSSSNLYSWGGFSLSMDNDQILAVSIDTDRKPEATILRSVRSGRFTTEAYLSKSFFPTFDGSSLFNPQFDAALDRDTAAFGIPNVRDGTRIGALVVLSRENGSWTLKPTLNLEDKNISGDIALADGWLAAIASQEVTLFKVAEPAPRPLITSSRPFQLVAGRPFSIPLASAEPQAGHVFTLQPDNLTWASIGGSQSAPTLTGTVPSNPSLSQTLRISATAGDGSSYDQTFDIKLLDSDDVPIVDSQTESQSAGIGQSIFLRTRISGTGPFTWQWLKGGVPIPGATIDRLSLRNLSAQDSGTYTVKITNAVGTTTSEPIEISVTPANRFAGDWSTFGNGPEHLGHHPATLGTHSFLPAWTANVRSDRRINRTVIADGKVFTTPKVYFGGPVHAKAFDLASGTQVWTHEFDEARSLNPPTYYNGRIYLQRGNHSGDTQLWALDARTGTAIWSAPHSAQWEEYEAPAVNEDGIWINGGSYGGMYGFDHDGNQLFFHNLAQYDEWTPSLYDGRLYSWAAGTFSEHNPFSGGRIWTIQTTSTHSPYSVNTISALTDKEALLKTDSELICIDLDSRAPRWQLTGSFVGSPAIRQDLVYIFDGGSIRSFNILTGSPDIIYTHPDTDGLFGSEQPLLLNDHLVAASETETFIYQYGNPDPVQTLPVGGLLSYSNGYLIIARTDGNISAYFANDIPDLADQQIPNATEDIRFSHQIQTDHDDPTEALVYRLLDGPAWVSLSPEGLLSGTLRHTQGGLQTITVEVADNVTQPVVREFTFDGIEVNDPPMAENASFTVQEDDPTWMLSFTKIFSDEESPHASLETRIVSNTNPEILSVSKDGSTSLLLTPLADKFGDSTITVEVTDEGGLKALSTVGVTIVPVNDRPVFTEDLPNLVANPAADPISVDLAAVSFDADPSDQLRYALVGNTNPSILSQISVGATDGLLSLRFAPYVAGSTVVTVRVSDSSEIFDEMSFTITLPDPPSPGLAAGPVTLNRQTGLFEQSITLTNLAGRAIGGFIIEVTELKNGYRLWGFAENQVAHQKPLAAGENVTLILEYYSASSGMTPSPELNATTTLPKDAAPPEDLGVPVDRLQVLEDRSVLVEFDSIAGENYAILYSYDMNIWYQVPVVIKAGTNRTQWFDRGMPATDCHPRECEKRFYRVVRLAE